MCSKTSNFASSWTSGENFHIKFFWSCKCTRVLPINVPLFLYPFWIWTFVINWFIETQFVLYFFSFYYVETTNSKTFWENVPYLIFRFISYIFCAKYFILMDCFRILRSTKIHILNMLNIFFRNLLNNWNISSCNYPGL